VNKDARCASERRARGFALILVLWFLVLIAAIGTYLMVNARAETAIARNIRLSASAEALADAGVAEAVFNLTDSIASNRWKLDGAPHRLELAGGEVVVRLSDENAKVNPNHASDALLAALLEAAGVDRTRARRLGAAIADWVGPDMMPRPLGAKLEQYQQAGLSYGPPNAPVESLDEFQLVLGMTPEIFAAVRPYLTIFTEDGEPHAANAPLVVQRALMLAARQPADSGSQSEAGEAEEPDDSGADTGAAAPAEVASEPAAGNKPAQTIVSVEITASTGAGGVFVRQAVLRLDPANPKGYAVLNWRRGELAE
jgi:general secretion pathway protein K